MKNTELQLVVSSAQGTVEQNRLSLENANKAADKLIALIEETEIQDNPLVRNLDEQCKSFLAKASKTAQTMSERRKPITQAFDQIRKYFTEYLSQRGDSVRLLEQYGILHSQVPQDEDIAVKILMSKISSPEEYYKFAKHSYGLYDNDMWRYYYAVGIVNLKDSAMIETAIDSLLPTLDSRHVASQLYMIYGEYFITKEADTIKGLSLYDLSLEKNPDNEYVLNNYAYFLYQMGGDMNRAEKMITHALEIKPLEATFLDTYACILFAKKDYFLAKFYMEKAIEQDGEDAVYYEHYGDILYHLNRPDEAIEQWKKAKGLGREDALLDRKIETGQYCR